MLAYTNQQVHYAQNHRQHDQHHQEENTRWKYQQFMFSFCNPSRRKTSTWGEVRCPDRVGVEVALEDLRRYKVGGGNFDVFSVSIIFTELGALAEPTNDFGELLSQLLEKYNACCAYPEPANVVRCAHRLLFRVPCFEIYQLRSEENSQFIAEKLRAKGFEEDALTPMTCSARIGYCENSGCTGQWYGFASYTSREICRNLWTEAWKFQAVLRCMASAEDGVPEYLQL